jgi:hypothetical protein
LVRSQLLHLFKHGREILRAGRSLANADSYGQPDADSYSNADAHTYSYGYGNSDCNANGDSCRNAYTYGYANSDSKTESNSEVCSNTQVSSDAGATPVALVDEKETHCSTPTSGREHAKNFGARTCPP